jgi:NAD(P)H-dependent flavin oxidoreductase YrpB (nitropropane dioxygenase family)
MPAGRDLRRLESPVMQAGMGSVARRELAAAVSEAGGIGTIAGVRADIATELAAARPLSVFLANRSIGAELPDAR